MFDALKVCLIALALLLATIVALLAEPDEDSADEEGGTMRSFSVDCVGGEAAQNPVGSDGTPGPRQEFLETIAEAEAFLCVDLPELTADGVWRPRETNAQRSHPLSVFEPGAWTAAENAYKYAEIYYGNESEETFMTLIVHPVDLDERQGIAVACGPPLPPAAGEPEEVGVTVQGVQTTLWTVQEPSNGPPTASVCWERDGLSYFAGVSFRPGFDVEDEILPLLDAIQ